MKLIDLLVQELPKRGGWPEGVVVITGDCRGNLYLWKKCNPSFSDGYWEHASGQGLKDYWCGSLSMSTADDYATSIVTRNQYEAALAAAQQPVWNGEGLPPVGCECEVRRGVNQWQIIKVLAVTGEYPVAAIGVRESVFYLEESVFRPRRSEADKKRDAIIEALAYHTNAADAADLYKAIEAGEVKGVKLDV